MYRQEIRVKNVTKKFGDTLAVDNLSLTLGQDKIYGLLGRNGAGKTTLLNLITNRVYPTEGEIFLDEKPLQEKNSALENIFYMGEHNLYPSSMKVKEAFKWTGEFYPNFDLDYANKLADGFGLSTKKKVKELSTGYSTIFKAILALASKAKFIFFDEPILGLDANHRELLYREILANYNAEPKTIVLSTHLIDEIADLLEEVIVIDQGKLVLKQSVEELLSSTYTVSGSVAKVEQYVQGRVVLGGQQLQNFKSVIVQGERDHALGESLALEFSKPELQKVFIGLTNK